MTEDVHLLYTSVFFEVNPLPLNFSAVLVAFSLVITLFARVCWFLLLFFMCEWIFDLVPVHKFHFLMIFERLYIFFHRHCRRKTYPSFLLNVLIKDNQPSAFSSPLCSYLFVYFLVYLFIYIFLYVMKIWLSVWKGRDWDVHLKGFL